MPKTLWNKAERDELLTRLTRLTPEANPAWGKMSASQMLAHLGSSMRMANGEIVAAPKKLPIRFTPLKQLIIYVLPFPKGAPTAPELLGRVVDNWDDNVADIRTRIAEFGARDKTLPWPDHPAFGKLTSHNWGALGYKHINHHFKQFGV